MCVFSRPSPPTVTPDPDVEIAQENEKQEEEAKREKAKQEQLEETVQRAGGGSGGTIRITDHRPRSCRTRRRGDGGAGITARPAVGGLPPSDPRGRDPGSRHRRYP